MILRLTETPKFGFFDIVLIKSSAHTISKYLISDDIS
jgi:hypothetical protein